MAKADHTETTPDTPAATEIASQIQQTIEPPEFSTDREYQHASQNL